jgi:hypothetical protein
MAAFSGVRRRYGPGRGWTLREAFSEIRKNKEPLSVISFYEFGVGKRNCNQKLNSLNILIVLSG